VSGRWRIAEFGLGIEGLALLRNWLVGDAGAAERRVEEIAALCARFAEPPAFDTILADEVSPETGYASLSATYDSAVNPLILAEEPPMQALLDTLPNGRILDAACGTGRHTRYLVDLGHHVTGLDPSAEMLREAIDKVPDARFVRGSVEAVPFATDSFDAAVCSLALTHLRGLEPAVQELARVVRPEGELMISDIHPVAATTGAHSVVALPDGSYGVVRNNVHLHSHYLAAFLANGFQVVSCLEPQWDTERFATGGIFDDYREAAVAGLDGMPWVLIWHLRRSSDAIDV
jgi:ubiquinone/menaquinone biosynthesis C-methylase UbiE